MNIEEIRDMVQARPFEPFRLHLSNGQTFDVPHPDFLMSSRTAVHVAVEPGEDGIPERIHRIALLHIASLEPIGGKPVRAGA